MRAILSRHSAILSILGLCFGCTGTAAPPVEPAPASASPDTKSEPAPVPAPSAAAPTSEPARSAEPPAPPPPPPVEPVPVLVDEAGKTLPQTDALPSSDSASFRRRLELLVEA